MRTELEQDEEGRHRHTLFILTVGIDQRAVPAWVGPTFRFTDNFAERTVRIALGK